MSGAGPRRVTAPPPFFLSNVSQKQIEVLGFRDGYFPSQSADIKDCFEAIKRDFDPTLILTHWQDDAHQDHQAASRAYFQYVSQSPRARIRDSEIRR